METTTAAELEAELELYPDEQGQILLDAAEAWRQAGDHDQASTLLNRAIALDNDDSADARVALADLLFDLDQTEQAQAQLDTLRERRPSSPTPYHLAAELLEERGDHQ